MIGHSVTRLSLKLLLITVLLTAQGFAFAHGIDHLGLEDNNCSVCAVGSGLDHQVAENEKTIQAVSCLIITDVRLNACPPKQFPVTHPSRGPPCSY